MSETYLGDLHIRTKETRASGARRIFIENWVLTEAGFPPGTSIDYFYDIDTETFLITPAISSDNSVSGRDKEGCVKPIIDLFNKTVGKFLGNATKFTVSVYYQLLSVKVHHEETNRTEREFRFENGIVKNSLSIEKLDLVNPKQPQVDVANVAIEPSSEFNNELYGPDLFNAMEAIKSAQPSVVYSRKMANPNNTSSGELFIKELKRIGYEPRWISNSKQEIIFCAYSKGLSFESVKETIERGLNAIQSNKRQFDEQEYMAQLILEREDRYQSGIEEGVLKKGMLYSGGGISVLAEFQGTMDAGLQSELSWVVEKEEKYQSFALRRNPAYQNQKKLRAFTGAVEELVYDRLSKTHMIGFSRICSPHSKSGKAKNKNKRASQHKESTDLFGTISVLRAVNAPILSSENVIDAKNDYEYEMIRQELHARKYVVIERTLDSKDTGSIENRQRYWFVAISEGLLVENYQKLEVPKYQGQYSKVKDILEPVAEAVWFSQDNYIKRENKNKAEGRNFRRQFYTEDAERIGLLNKTYGKRQVSQSHLIREDGMIRLFTPYESALARSIPKLWAMEMCANLPVIFALEIMGQSIDFNQGRGMIMFAFLLTGVVSYHQIAANDCIIPTIKGNEITTYKPISMDSQMSLFG